MAEPAEEPAPPQARGRRLGCLAVVVALVVLAAGALVLWLSRERIADNVIADTLESYGIEATYEIEQIGPYSQILRNVVVGDPERPDLTIERAIVRTNLRFGMPTLGRITAVRPRLYGTYLDGKLSFGALDPLLFEEKDDKPFELPDLDVAIEDGRALLETDFGPMAAKITGQGNLRDGFAGEIAAITPRLSLAGCESRRATLYGQVRIDSRKPRFEGPLRFDRLRCEESGIDLRSGALQLTALTDETLSRVEGDADLALGASAFPQGLVAATRGQLGFTWRPGELTGRFDLQSRGLAAAEISIGRLALTGSLRTRRNFTRVELGTQLEGEGVRLGSGLGAALADAAGATRDTLLSPLLDRVREGLAREGRASSLTAELTVRQNDRGTAVIVPQAVLRGTSGSTLLALSRVQVATGATRAMEVTGSFATGGEGLPRVVGSMTIGESGRVRGRLAMADYVAGEARMAVPGLEIVRRSDGAIGFSGSVRVSGPLPGGRADNLLLPVSGSRSPGGAVTLWPTCVPLRFDGLQYANLTLGRQSLTLCPSPGQSILRYDRSGLRIAAGASALRLAGQLGETPIALSSGPVGFAYPGTLTARQLQVTLGPADNAQRFLVSDLTARVGEEVAGNFTGADVHLFSVPLDVVGASGNWRYSDGRLSLSDGAFRLVDRQKPERFFPLTARGAELALENNLISARALLREPRTDREVTRVDLRHDLNTGRGHADLAVDSLSFDSALQPASSACAAGAAPPAEARGAAGLTCLAFGVVANVQGTVTGSGRIDWDASGVTSSGRFSSNSLDFAAAFGPVRGASGTIEFTDLLGLTTAPNQRIRVASVNPGIEVTEGEVLIEVRGGQVLAVQGGTWPFMGGTLTLRPVAITFGAAEERRYVLEIVGLDAARFVQHMELNNLAASGIFDGTVPVVFGANGIGRVEEGLLLSRPPGGNISYIGTLTYENLGTVANFAFGALRSLDYRQMRIALNGNLTGEIVTNVRFDGVSQGAGTRQNFLTRQIAKLPFRFDVNIRAPFYSLITNIRSMYDPTMIRDPRELGLIDADGNVIRRETDGVPPPPVTPGDLIPEQPAIQRRESEEMP